jgi:hypothetical protein
MALIKAVNKAFKKLEVNGKKEKTFMKMGFKPK